MPRMDVVRMPFAKLYPLLVDKAEKKGRTRQAVDQATVCLPDTAAGTSLGWNSPVSAMGISFGTLPLCTLTVL